MKNLLILAPLVVIAAAMLAPAAGADESRPGPRETPVGHLAKIVEDHSAALARLDASYREAVRVERNRHVRALSSQLDAALDREDLEIAMAISKRLSLATAALESARVVHPAGAASQGFRVLAARWGMGTRWTDVTDRVNGYVGVSGVDVRVNHRSFGDPAPHWKKTLFLTYEQAGELKVKVVAEDRRLRLP